MASFGNDANPQGRLDGWKEISAYVGRGVRTAQRWERELGMPVHRLNTGPGDAIFALKDEIDTWLLTESRSSLAPTTADGEPSNGDAGANGASGYGDSAGIRPAPQPGSLQPPPAADHLPRSVWISVGAAGALAAFLLWRALGAAPAPVIPTPGEPSTVELVGRTMTVFGPHHEQLWSQHFEIPLTDFDSPFLWARGVAVGDLDGDGNNDVVIARTAPADAHVYAWSHDGHQRFVHTLDRPARFGEYECPPTWPTNVLIEAHPRFPRTLWVWGQHPLYFPAVLQLVEATGKVRSEYWSNGYINTVASVELGGRQVTLVGGANNETGGASLAVFRGEVSGSAPAANPNYRCTGCPPGGPDAFLVFPQSLMQAALGAIATVQKLVPVGGDRFTVHVLVGGPNWSERPMAVAYYTLDANLRLVDAELGSVADAVHQQYEAEKLVTAATRFRGKADLFPVRRWNGTGWDSIMGPERGVR
jgi:hypothetical protein